MGGEAINGLLKVEVISHEWTLGAGTSDVHETIENDIETNNCEGDGDETEMRCWDVSTPRHLETSQEESKGPETMDALRQKQTSSSINRSSSPLINMQTYLKTALHDQGCAHSSTNWTFSYEWWLRRNQSQWADTVDWKANANNDYDDTINVNVHETFENEAKIRSRHLTSRVKCWQYVSRWDVGTLGVTLETLSSVSSLTKTSFFSYHGTPPHPTVVANRYHLYWSWDSLGTVKTWLLQFAVL